MNLFKITVQFRNFKRSNKITQLFAPKLPVLNAISVLKTALCVFTFTEVYTTYFIYVSVFSLESRFFDDETTAEKLMTAAIYITDNCGCLLRVKKHL